METTTSLSTLETPLVTPMTNVQLGLVSASLAASVITIAINPLTLLALFNQRMLTKTSINLFIGSLCCSDFLLGVSVFLFQLQKLLQLGSTDEQEIAILSWIAGVFMVTGFFMSNINAFLISLDRAYATLAPFSYKSRMSIQRAAIALVIAWVSASIQGIIPMAIKLVMLGDITILNYPYEVHPTAFKLYWAVPLLYIGISTNVILYAVIVIAFFKVEKKVRPSTSTAEIRNQRMTRMVTIVIGSLLLGNLPVTTVAALPENPNAPYIWSYRMFYDVAALCLTIPTFCNNFIYVWQLPDFNRAFRRLLACRGTAVNNRSLETSVKPTTSSKAPTCLNVVVITPHGALPYID